MTSRLLTCAAALLAAALLVPGTAAATPGTLSQLASPFNCFNELGTGGCQASQGLESSTGIATSPDGENVYVLGEQNVVAYAREQATGRITQRLGCLSGTGVPGCTNVGKGLRYPSDVTVSPDGENVYVSFTGQGAGQGGVSAFTRLADGQLGAQSCWTGGGLLGCINAGGNQLDTASGIAVSPDGENVYVTGSLSDSLTTFARDPADGDLDDWVGCVSELGTGVCDDGAGLDGAFGVTVGPDDTGVYVASLSDLAAKDGAVSWFSRSSIGKTTFVGCISELGGGVCDNGYGLTYPTGVAASPDGKNVFVVAAFDDTGDGAVTSFSRNAASGALTEVGCVSEKGGATCQNGYGLAFAYGVAVSPDSADVYVSAKSSVGGAVTSLARGSGGLLSVTSCRAENAAAFVFGIGCRAGDGLAGAEALAVSPDGLTVYVSAPDSGDGGFSAFARQIAPACTDTTVTAAREQTLSVSLPCTDANQEALTRSVVTPPANGTLGALDQASGTIPYTSNPGFTGNDSFTFRASQGGDNSNTSTVSITVVEPDSPEAPPADPTDPGTEDPTDPLPGANGAPDSNIKKIKKRIRRRKLKRFKGTATDDSGLERVEISLVRATKKRCLTLNARGRFGKKARNGRCTPVRFLTATGTAAWSFKLKRKLPRGRYVLYSRAVDTSALTETKFSRKGRNRVRFKVI